MSDVLQSVRDRAESSGRFAEVRVDGDRLACRARDSAAEAWYEVHREGAGWAVLLRTPDRWLSESIEGDMLEGNDTAEELVDDELVEVGFAGRCRQVRHFRDDDRMYVFRTTVPAEGLGQEPDGVAAYLLAFEAAFAQLGDMQGSSQE